ncbi:MAG TPA: hypothetical protein VK641_07270 [Terriglobales bacterium]|nr:hypothetical protein [Terriglobales bacterium]
MLSPSNRHPGQDLDARAPPARLDSAKIARHLGEKKQAKKRAHYRFEIEKHRGTRSSHPGW